jgi:hypothetical protein
VTLDGTRYHMVPLYKFTTAEAKEDLETRYNAAMEKLP